jgi:hypothetical protein
MKDRIRIIDTFLSILDALLDEYLIGIDGQLHKELHQDHLPSESTNLARLLSCSNPVRHPVSEVRQRRRSPDRFEVDSWLIPNEKPNGMNRA